MLFFSPLEQFNQSSFIMELGYDSYVIIRRQIIEVPHYFYIDLINTILPFVIICLPLIACF